MEYGKKFDPSALDPRFVPFYEGGERIKIETCGMVVTGTIGITTGWKPCFLLMRTSRSIGSSYTLDKKDKILGVKRTRGYVQGYVRGYEKVTA